jgi:hypothetical protein
VNAYLSGRRTTAMVGGFRMTSAAVSLLIGMPSFLIGAYYLVQQTAGALTRESIVKDRMQTE